MCQPYPGRRCAGAIGTARRAARSHEVDIDTDISVVEAERPVSPQGEPFYDEKTEQRILALHYARARNAALQARLDDEWAATPAGREEAEQRNVPGTVAHAEALAERLHADQKDKIGARYIHHVRAVAEFVREDGGSDEEVIAAYLHDTVEDVDGVTLDSLRADGVPGESVRLVEAVTHPSGEDYGDTVARVIRAGAKARRLKRNDLRHNTLPERNAPLVRVKVALGRRRALAAGRDPDRAEADVRLGTDRRARRYADAKIALARADAAEIGLARV